MSILAWVNVTNFSNYRSIVGKTPPSSVPAPYDYYLISGSGVPTLYRGNGSANANVSGTSAPATGVWQYVAVTMTGTSGGMILPAPTPSPRAALSLKELNNGIFKYQILF
jgi:hypothetical protein